MSRQQTARPAATHEHARIEVVTRCPDCGLELGRQTFNRADLEPQSVMPLPRREAMSIIGPGVAAPLSLAPVVNILSDGSIAMGGAPE
jgi:hypothetical protein